MSDISLDIDELEPIIRIYKTASVTLDEVLSREAPTSVDAGEVSDVMAVVLFALMDSASTLSLYGQGLAAQATAAVQDLHAYEQTVASSLDEMLGRMSTGDSS